MALQLLLEDGWSPPWIVDPYAVGWCIHDSLTETTLAWTNLEAFDGYIEALNVLSDELGEPVLEWEREPNRTEDEVIELFQRVLAA
ncbi:hypothetical protein A5747_13535 [Mycobacterium sp. IS-836]|nr:hypothetical protein A5747_13535 [Mycobacterium sp. IS-836]